MSVLEIILIVAAAISISIYGFMTFYRIKHPKKKKNKKDEEEIEDEDE